MILCSLLALPLLLLLPCALLALLFIGKSIYVIFILHFVGKSSPKYVSVTSCTHPCSWDIHLEFSVKTAVLEDPGINCWCQKTQPPSSIWPYPRVILRNWRCARNQETAHLTWNLNLKNCVWRISSKDIKSGKTSMLLPREKRDPE